MLSTLVLLALIIGIMKIVLPDMGETVTTTLNIFIVLALIYLLFKIFLYLLDYLPMLLP